MKLWHNLLDDGLDYARIIDAHLPELDKKKYQKWSGYKQNLEDIIEHLKNIINNEEKRLKDLY